MKKFILGFITALIVVAVVFGIVVFLPGFFEKKNGPLYDADVKKAKESVLCDAIKHSCSYYEKSSEAGNLKVSIASRGNPVEGLEVDVADKPGAPQYYVKITDNGGMAMFSGLPAGNYTIYFNGVNFPKEYGDAPAIPFAVLKDQTVERTIELK